MPMNFLVVRVAASICTITACTGLLAHPLAHMTFDNVGQIHGGAVAVLLTEPRLLIANLTKCESIGALSANRRKSIQKQWQRRNEKLLSLQLIYEDEKILGALASASGSGMVAMQGAMFSTLSSAEQVKACKAFAESVTKGQLDLEAKPQIGAYLKQEFLQLSAPGKPIDATIALCFQGDRDGENDSDQQACERATALGSPFAMYRHGVSLVRLAVANSKANPRARELLLVAANAGVGDAQRALANDYQMGMSGPVDYPQAKFWYETAISQFDKLAPKYLAGMYALGMGVPADTKKAMVLIALGAAWGDETTSGSLDTIAQELGLLPDDLTIAKSEAAKLQCQYQSKSLLFKGVELDCMRKLL
jgi:hypothetical protein